PQTPPLLLELAEDEKTNALEKLGEAFEQNEAESSQRRHPGDCRGGVTPAHARAGRRRHPNLSVLTCHNDCRNRKARGPGGHHPRLALQPAREREAIVSAISRRFGHHSGSCTEERGA